MEADGPFLVVESDHLQKRSGYSPSLEHGSVAPSDLAVDDLLYNTSLILSLYAPGSKFVEPMLQVLVLQAEAQVEDQVLSIAFFGLLLDQRDFCPILESLEGFNLVLFEAIGEDLDQHPLELGVLIGVVFQTLEDDFFAHAVPLTK